MLVYEVNLEIDADTVDEYMNWLKPHAQELVNTGCFTKFSMYTRNPEDEGSVAERKLVTVHYFANEWADVDRYLKEHAPRMRADGDQRFSGKFSASRRILRELV
eukprot:Rmarinus@m.26692